MLPQKKELRKIFKQDIRRLNSWDKNTEYIVTAFIEKDILIIDFYGRNGNIYARVFQTKDDFTTLLFEKNKFIKSRFTHIENVKCFRNYSFEHEVNTKFENDEYEKIVLNFLGASSRPFENLLKLQNEVLYKKRLAKEDEIFKYTEEHMKQIEQVGEEFTNWAIDFTKREHTWMFKKKGVLVCSNCGEVQTDAKANTTTICPVCKHKARVTTALYKGEIFYLEKLEKSDCPEADFLLRTFEIRSYSSISKSTEIFMKEIRREYISAEGIVYQYNMSFYKVKERWIEKSDLKDEEGGTLFEFGKPRYSTLYPIIDKDIKEKLNRTGYEILIKNETKTVWSILLQRSYWKEEINEYIIKAGMTELLNDLLEVPEYGLIKSVERKLHKALGIEKSHMQFMKQYNLGIEGLEFVQMSEKIKMEPKKEYLDIALKVGNHKWFEMLEYSKPQKAINYVKKQLKIMKISKPWGYDYKKYQQYKWKTVIDTWIDYLKMAKKLNWNVEDSYFKYPKNLVEAHNEVLRIVHQNEEKLREKKRKEDSKKIAEMKEKLEKEYSFEAFGYTIVAPRNAQEIVKEGNKLKHCVGRSDYIERMAEGKTVILFLRKLQELDKPFVTIEIINGKIGQYHGYNNEMTKSRQLPKEVHKFMKMFEEQVLSKRKIRIAV